MEIDFNCLDHPLPYVVVLKKPAPAFLAGAGPIGAVIVHRGLTVVSCQSQRARLD